MRPVCIHLLLGSIAFVLLSGAAAAQNGADDAAIGSWPLEEIKLLSGQVYQGLIDVEGLTGVEFMEVRRPPGKPMYLLVRHLERKDILSWQRLSDAERDTLRQRIAKFKNHALIESRRMDDLRLTPSSRDGAVYWQYRGTWFSLESTTDEATTRQAVVRIEQVFTAYRQILPAVSAPKRRLQIMLFGSTDQYREFVRGLGFEVSNPSLYIADFNLVVAGSDMNRLSAELAKVRKRASTLKKEQDALIESMPDRLRQLAEDLKKNGVPAQQRQKIRIAEQKKWEDQRHELDQQIKAAERRNTATFNEMAGQMLARLYHEAFHAYLENSVYPHHQFDVPRWLNEGLAQTLESGRIEVDTLRVDAPDPQLLARLKSDLKGDDPLPLSDLLSAAPSTFLLNHREATTATASRFYVYSWGLAYYLTFMEPSLQKPEFAEYVSLAQADALPVARFEQLIGRSLPEFERTWRAAMLQLKSKR
jgi:hypothetical protein